MKKRTRPYFRISIKGYYPDATSKLKGLFYVKQESVIAEIIQLLATIKEK